MQRSWSRASAVSVAGTVLGMLGLLLIYVPIAAGSSFTCDYIPRTDKVRIVITGSGTTNVHENAAGQIMVGSTWCENVATVTNTDQINIFAGAGDQTVTLHWNGAGFKPGATNEVGDSDEIEFYVSLGTGTDGLFVGLDGSSDKVRAGRSSGFGVIGKVNLNAGETTGIDADITLVVGIERLSFNGSSGNDVISGAGGAGTGDDFTIPLALSGHIGNDTLTGGTAADEITGAEGNDILKGRGGPDFLNASDGVSGNDEAIGGTGADTCLTDPGDSKTSC